MIARVFEVKQDGRYDYLCVAPHDHEDWRQKMFPMEQSIRGASLKSRWNDDWDFVVMEEDWEHADHPEGLGDFAYMHRLIAATNKKAFDFLTPLLGDAAEVLKGNFKGRSIWLFNVIRHVDCGDIDKLEDCAAFRVNPTRLRIHCRPGFKEAVERSGLKGLAFREVDPDDEYGLI